MNNYSTLTVKRSSKLYKTYHWLYKNVVGQNHLNPAYAFRDVCTFLRVTLFSFISIPFILLCATLLFSFFVIYPLVSVIHLVFPELYFMPKESITSGIALFIVYLLFIVTYLHMEYANYTFITKHFSKDKPKQPNIFVQSIKDKHNKICRQIEIID